MLSHRPTPRAASILRDAFPDRYIEVTGALAENYIRECYQIAQLVHPHLSDADDDATALDLALSVAGSISLVDLATIVSSLDLGHEPSPATLGLTPHAFLLATVAEFGGQIIADTFSRLNPADEPEPTDDDLYSTYNNPASAHNQKQYS